MDRERFWAFLEKWIFDLVAATPSPARPLMVGLSAVQGSGKTTLTRELCRRAAAQGLRAVSVSIDDFYLTRKEQAEITRLHSDNPYLQHRGYPGTHDVDLGTRTLTALKRIGQRGRVLIPSYDKTAWSGAGDRRSESAWPVVEAPLDLVIVEGWMLGFTPIDTALLPDPHMRVINDTLARYAPWTSLLDAFIWLEAEDPRFAVEWRMEAEEQSRAAGNPGMTAEEVKAFTEAYLPAYVAYRRSLVERRAPGSSLHIVIGRDRLPVSLPE